MGVEEVITLILQDTLNFTFSSSVQLNVTTGSPEDGGPAASSSQDQKDRKSASHERSTICMADKGKVVGLL